MSTAREITIVMDIDDDESPDMPDAEVAESIRGFFLDQLGYLQFVVKNITVTSKS